MSRFESWCNQFCGDEERFFAACVLDQLIFRTAQQFEAGLRSLFRSNLSGTVFPAAEDLRLSELMSSREDAKIRLVPVICETDPPTKSGPLVLRRLQRILQVSSKWMCWPWQATDSIRDNGVSVVIFVDDFLGSGAQFERFFTQWGFNQHTDAAKYFYAPVVAHEQGLKYLGGVLPDVCVVPAERLGDSHAFFSKEVWDRLGRGRISETDAREWYAEFARQKNLEPSNVGIFGYGDLALTFGFGHSTPNNSLPILWYETAAWQPLLER